MIYEPLRLEALKEKGFDENSEADEWLIHTWNEEISPNDNVLCLGDLTYTKYKKH